MNHFGELRNIIIRLENYIVGLYTEVTYNFQKCPIGLILRTFILNNRSKYCDFKPVKLWLIKVWFVFSMWPQYSIVIY